MKAADFIKNIESGTLQHAYCFTGPEEWIKQEAVKRLREKLLPAGLEGFNDTTLDQPSLKQIIDAADTLPVMCDKRIIIARDWPLFRQNKEKGIEEEVKALEGWLASPIDTSVTIFYNHGSVTNKSLLKCFEKIDADITFEALDGHEITTWANRRLKKDGKRIDARAIEALTARAGNDLTRLDLELDKLAAFVGDRTEIKKEDVETVVPQSLEQRVYELTGFLLDGRLSQANALLDTLLSNGEDPFGILAYLTGQMRRLCHIRLALDANQPAQALIKPLNIRNESALKAMTRRSRVLSAAAYKHLYMHLVDLDYSIKSGGMRDIEALTMAMLEIAQAAKNKGRRA